MPVKALILIILIICLRCIYLGVPKRQKHIDSNNHLLLVFVFIYSQILIVSSNSHKSYLAEFMSFFLQII